MRTTETYRRHHDELRAIGRRIESMLDADHVANAPSEVAELVRLLFAKFSVHLAIEDRSLYPRCQAHLDAAIRTTAARFLTEMGGLSAEVDAYRRSWPGPLAIGRDPARFVTETRRLLAALTARVAREERELYDLIDRAA